MPNYNCWNTEENLPSELERLEKEKDHVNSLDHVKTEQEIRQAVKKIKNKKLPFLWQHKERNPNASLYKPFNLILQWQIYMMSTPYYTNLQIRWEEWSSKLQKHLSI